MEIVNYFFLRCFEYSKFQHSCIVVEIFSGKIRSVPLIKNTCVWLEIKQQQQKILFEMRAISEMFCTCILEIMHGKMVI